MGNVALHFVANQGQWTDDVAYSARSEGATVYCTDEGIVFGFAEGKVGLTFSDQRRVKPEARGLLPGVVNYFVGHDAARWQAGVPTFQEVVYSEVYPGIDLVYEGSQRLLKYTYYLQPGSDPGQIRMTFDGVERVSVDAATGELVIRTPWGEMRDAAPVAYQESQGVRQNIAVAFRLIGEHGIGFAVGAYDPDALLIIDPEYSTYLGGSGDDRGRAIAVDGDGNAYVTGATNPGGFPLLNAYDSSINVNGEAFVTKLSSSGTLVYSTYLGGSGFDYGYGIAVDGDGNAYVTGGTQSSDFPLLNAYDSSYNGGSDAFVTKLSSNGVLVYATYLGGSDNDVGNSIAVDGDGKAYVAGNSSSGDFPSLNAFDSSYNGGLQDVFVTKLSSNGALVYATYLGGSENDQGGGIAADGDGNAYVMGYTASGGFPILNAYDSSYNGEGDAFVTKLSSGGALVYSTFLGGNTPDVGYSIAADGHGNAYVTGRTASGNFPLLNAFDSNYNGGIQDMFVTKLSSNGVLIYSTLLGGSSADYGIDIAADGDGNAYVTGNTDSGDFPILNAFDTSYNGGDSDAFVTKLSSNGALVYATYLGGSGSDRGEGIAVDGGGNAYVTGQTFSGNFPLLNAYDSSFNGGGEAFVMKLLVGPTLTASLASLDFGVVTINASMTDSLVVSNTGTTPLLVSELTSTNTQFAATPTSFSVAAGDSQVVTVTFTPTKVGWERGTLVITHNASEIPDTVTASGIGRVNPLTGVLSDTRIVFESNRAGGRKVFLMAPDGSNQTRVTVGEVVDFNPSWSPDGTRLVFHSNRVSDSDIYVMEDDGTNVVRLTNNPAGNRNPAWSPDGTRIAFQSGSEIYVMDADGTHEVRLTNNAVEDDWPRWSPEGSKLAFYSTRDGNRDIFVMNADGTNPVNLTHDSANDWFGNWSPDGTRIIFVSNRDGDDDLYVMNADGTNVTQLTNDPSVDFVPSFSPDGTQIAFRSNRDGNQEIYTIHADGTQVSRLTNNPAEEESPFWSPFPPVPSLLPITLLLSPVFGEPGDTVTVPITLTNPNTTAVGGLEWQVIRGSNAVQFDSLITSVPGFTANANTTGDTTFVLFHSPNSAVIPPGTVFLGSLRYLIDAEAPLCTPMSLTVQALVIGDSLGAALPDSSVNGEIQAGIPGDVNLDRRVSILDIIKLVRVIVAKDPEPDSTTCPFFIADFNGDDGLDILDVIGQVNTILHLTKQIAVPAPTTAVIRLGSPQTGSSGGLVIPVELQSDGLIAGLQATVRFDPSTISVGTPQLTGPAAGLSLDASVQNGVLRFVVFGMQQGQGITDGTGSVLLIPITLRNGATELPFFDLSDVVVASAQAQRVPVTIGTPVKAAALPTAFSLGTARPNPFNPSTQIAYEVPQQAHIKLAVYNLLGQEVVRLVNVVQQAGRYTVTWNAHNAQGQAVSSGVYLYRLTSSTGFIESHRMVLLK